MSAETSHNATQAGTEVEVFEPGYLREALEMCPCLAPLIFGQTKWQELGGAATHGGDDPLTSLFRRHGWFQFRRHNPRITNTRARKQPYLKRQCILTLQGSNPSVQKTGQSGGITEKHILIMKRGNQQINRFGQSGGSLGG